MVNIEYSDSTDCGQRFQSEVERIVREQSLRQICDIGGGANPLLSEQFHKEQNLSYTLLDISQDELDKAPITYNKLHADILDKQALPKNAFDLMFSQTVAEHVSDGQLFHENIYESLKPGGYSMHIFPTLYSIPFVVNKYLPEGLSSKILDTLVPRDRYQHEKFPAYYSWCYGPTKKMIGMLTGIGYDIPSYQGLFGHRYYRFLSIAHKLHEKNVDFLLKHPTPYLTSYAVVILRKPLS